MPIKKKKKPQVSIKNKFLEAAKIAVQLEKKKPIKKETVFVKKEIDAPIKLSAYSPPKPAERLVSKTDFSTLQTPYDRPVVTDSIKGRNLDIIGKKVNSSDELVGFNDLTEIPFERVKDIDANSSGIVEMLGGATIVLILVEVIVLIIILVLMFFLK